MRQPDKHKRGFLTNFRAIARPASFFASLVATLAACHPSHPPPPAHPDGGTDAGIDAGQPPYVGPFVATVGPHPENVVCVLVQVESEGADSVAVVSGADSSYGSTTPSISMSGGRATVPVCGLTPAATSHFQVTTYSNGVQSEQSGDLTFATDAMPAFMPAISVISGTATSPYIGMGFIWSQNGSPELSITVIVNSAGRIVWYHGPQNCSGNATTCFYLESPLPGQFLVWNGIYGDDSPTDPDGPAQFQMEDLAGNVLHTWSDTWPGYFASEMDMTILPSGNAALLGYTLMNNVTVPWGSGTVAGQTVISESIDEITPDGGAVSHWQSWPEIGPSDSTEGWAPGDIFEVHANSIDVFPNGDFLISLHDVSAVLRVTPQGNIVWQLGGNGNQFQFMTDPRNGFGGQHDVRVLANGHVLLMDDRGPQGQPLGSRAVEYVLDETLHTATLIWAYYAAPGLLSDVCGSTRRLANGNTLVDFGALGQVFEVDNAGNVVFELDAPLAMNASPDFLYIYRAVPIASLY